MNKKILIWIDDSSFLQYCFSTLIKQKIECKIFAIADVNKYGKKFLQKQNLLDIEKIWFYRDFLSTKETKFDIKYLEEFEKKYKINLWLIIYSERLFYNYTTYYKPSKDEILGLVESSCKIFEKILDISKPDFLLIKNTDNFQNTLLFELAKAKGIKILTFASGKLANSSHISIDADKIDEVASNKGIQSYRNQEISEFLKNHDPYQKDEKKRSLEMPTIKKKFSFFLKHLGEKKIDNSFFAYHGRGSISFYFKNLVLILKSFSRKKFLDKNTIQKIEDEEFVYFPLHVEPERSILITSPFYSDQLNVITNIAKSLPVGYKLYVKEHGSMVLYSWRKTSFYKNITKLQNVKLIHPSVNPKTLLEKCKIVITISGTVGLEALLHNKPVIVLADVLYSSLPTVFRMNSFEDLPRLIMKSLLLKTHNEGSKQLAELYKKECLNVDMIDLQHECLRYLGAKGITEFTIPQEEKLAKFIHNNKSKLELIADEHINKIILFENDKIKIGKRRNTMSFN